METVGLVITAAHIGLLAPQRSSRLLNRILTWLWRDIQDHGFIQAVIVRIYQPEAWPVVMRVHKHVLRAKDPHKEALSFKESHITGYNMVGITGAIVAQIAITALSLPNLEETHWTAEASFVVSIIAGCLAVYAACLVQIHLGKLHDSFAMCEWLSSKSTPQVGMMKFLYGPGKGISVSAALMLTAPVTLLHWALSSLITGLGVYYGFIYGKDIGNLKGKNANLAVMLCFVLFTLMFIIIFFAPHGWNIFDRTIRTMDKAVQRAVNKHKLHDEEHQPDAIAGAQMSVSGASTASVNPNAPQRHQSPSQQVPDVSRRTERLDPVLTALQTSVASQKAALRDLEALIQSHIEAQVG